MSDIHREISRIEKSHDHLWSVREDLHARFNGVVKPHLIDGVLDSVAGGYEGRIGRFRKIFIAKSATWELEAIAGTSPSRMIAAPGLAAA